MAIVNVIGKIILSDQQRLSLTAMGAGEIAFDNPRGPKVKEKLVRRIGNARAVITNTYCPLDAKILAKCPQLEFIQTWSTGQEHIDLAFCKEHNIRVMNVINYSSQAVAEKTLGLILMAAGRISEAHASVISGVWDYTTFSGFELKNKHITIVGYGAIGRRVGEFLTAFGAKIIPINSKSSSAELKEALKISSVVSLHCSLNSKTRSLFNQQTLSLLNNAILVNASRGGVIDEKALLEALELGHIRWACLDVLQEEPPKANNPLVHHPRVYLTPHSTWNSQEAVKALTDRCISNVADFLKSPSHSS